MRPGEQIDDVLERHGALEVDDLLKCQLVAERTELGVEPLMTGATVKRQRDMGEIGKQDQVRASLDQGRAKMLGAISAAARDRH